HPPVIVEDNNPCTDDGCLEPSGIYHNNTALGTTGASDGLICTHDRCYGNGNTNHIAVAVDDSNPCTDDGCAEPNGVYHHNTASGTAGASDGLICTDDL